MMVWEWVILLMIGASMLVSFVISGVKSCFGQRHEWRNIKNAALWRCERCGIVRMRPARYRRAQNPTHWKNG